MTPHAIEKILLQDPDTPIVTSILDRYRPVLDSLDSVYVFGAGRTGSNVARHLAKGGIRVIGFIDNSPAHENVDGIPVNPLDAIADKNATIVIGTGYQYPIARQLTAAGFHRHVSYHALSLRGGILPRDISFQDIEDLPGLTQELIALYEMLGDRESKETLKAVLRYRTSLDPSHLHRVARDKASQYFDRDVVSTSDGDSVFVDGGGYDGDSTAAFFRFSRGSYKHVYYFEPDTRLCDAARRSLRLPERTTFLNLGLWSQQTTRYFQETGGMDGFMSDGQTAGSVAVPCSTLDREIEEPITFIKLDIEGAETAAIQGSARHIRQDRPVIACAWDHSSGDLVAVPRAIRSLGCGYTMRIRHYGDTVSETVAYFTQD